MHNYQRVSDRTWQLNIVLVPVRPHLFVSDGTWQLNIILVPVRPHLFASDGT